MVCLFVADMGQSLPPADEEGRDLLFRRAPAQQQHLLLGQHEFAGRELVDPDQKMRPLLDEMRERFPGEAAHRHGINRIRRIAVAIGRRRAEKIARQRKADHLTPPVRQQLVQARHARGHIVDGTSDLACREERLIGGELNMAGDPLELHQIVLVERAADAQRADGTGRAAAEIGAIWIRRDGSYHCHCPFERHIGRHISRPWQAAQRPSEI